MTYACRTKIAVCLAVLLAAFPSGALAGNFVKPMVAPSGGTPRQMAPDDVLELPTRAVETALAATDVAHTSQLATTAAINLYVETTGDDSSSGAQAEPLLTIQAAVNRVPRFIRHPVNIHVGAGDFAGASIAGFTVGNAAVAADGAYTDISTATTAIKADDNRYSARLSAVTGAGNTTVVNATNGANVFVASTCTITGTTEISIDGAASDFATMRAATPKYVTNATTGSRVWGD